MRSHTTRPAFDKIVRKLDHSIQEKIYKRMEKIIENPELGKLLQGYLKNHFSERVEHVRIIYIFNELHIEFVYLENRDKVYVPHTFNDSDGHYTKPLLAFS